MRIEGVEIKNGCQHRSFKSELGPGVIVVEGPNGSGKSNLIKLIVRGITGLAMNYGKKEDDLTFNETQGFVTVDFSVAGQKGTIMRNLKNASCKMTFGGREFKTVKEIDEAIFGILGISAKVMAEIIMAQQGKIESVLFQPPAERARSMQELFGTLQAEKLRDILAEDLADTPIASRADTIRQLEDGLRVNIKGPLAQASSDLQEVRKVQLTPELKTYNEEIVRNYETQQANQTALATAVKDETECKTQIEKHDARMTVLTKSYNDNLAVINDLRPLAQELREKIASADKNKMIKGLRDAAISNLQECTAKLALPEPKCEASQTNLDKARTLLNTLSSEIHTIRTMVQSVGGKTVCPTCQQPVSTELLAQKTSRLNELMPQAAGLSNAVNQSESMIKVWTQQYAQWQANINNARTMHAKLQEQIASLPEVTIPSDQDLALDKQTVGDFDALERSQERTQADLNNMQGFRATIVDGLTKATERRKAVEQCKASVGDPELYRTAKELLEKHGKAILVEATLTGRIVTLEDQLKTAEAQIATLKVEEAKLEKVKEWRELVEKARQFLHRDQLPNLVAQSYIRALNGRLAKYLDMFEVPYTCKIGPEMDVVCAFSGGRKLPAERLSGGEKVMLGIAFRFAIYDLFAGNLGLLILDEPTVFLDDDRIDCVYDLLEKVKSYSKSAGLQLIVITHEKRLAAVADRVISL
jgi:DNA repair exonuclease SbcCD ATPase subunit